MERGQGEKTGLIRSASKKHKKGKWRAYEERGGQVNRLGNYLHQKARKMRKTVCEKHVVFVVMHGWMGDLSWE